MPELKKEIQGNSGRNKFVRIGPTIWGRGIIEDTTHEQNFIFGFKI